MFRPATTEAEAHEVAKLLGLVFDPYEINHWLVGASAQERQERMTNWFEILVQHALTAGQVIIAEDYAGAAVWFDRTGEGSEPPNYEARREQAAGPYAARFEQLDELLDENHPQEPHWHLAFLAVHPDRQRNGLGSKLLQYTHDKISSPVYLEATSLDSRRLYEERHGYFPMTPTEIRPGDGPAFYRMWRPADA
jgi:ribosomal protein S18 acetylase RimI-like enzyme